MTHMKGNQLHFFVKIWINYGVTVWNQRRGGKGSFLLLPFCNSTWIGDRIYRDRDWREGLERDGQMMGPISRDSGRDGGVLRNNMNCIVLFRFPSIFILYNFF